MRVREHRSVAEPKEAKNHKILCEFRLWFRASTGVKLLESYRTVKIIKRGRFPLLSLRMKIERLEIEFHSF